MNRNDFRHVERLRVRWAEIDAQQIVFNGHYLMYFDTAMAGYWRAAALPYHAAMSRLRGDLYVRKATLEYEGSARNDERLEIGVRCVHIGNSALRFAAAVFRGGRRLVHGELVYVFADPATQTSRPVPAALRALLQGFEAGEPVVQLHTGDWAAQSDAVKDVRQAVQPPPGAALDDADDAGDLHGVLLNRLQMPVACGRLRFKNGQTACIQGLAVVPALQGTGLGQHLLRRLMAAARSQGRTLARVKADPPLAGFYLRQGFVRCDAEPAADPAQPVVLHHPL